MNADNFLVRALHDIKAHQPPKTLFKFSHKDGLMALVQGQLKLSPPAFFNDPFEMWAGIATETLTEEKMVRSVTAPNGLFKTAVRYKNPEAVRDIGAYDRMITTAVRDTPDKWSSHLSSMVGAIKILGLGQIGVCCFSGFSDAEMLGEIGIRHWAMYGNDHKGFCVEFDGEHEFFKVFAEMKWLFPVNYLTSRMLVDLNEFDDWNNQKMWRTIREWLAMKSASAWGHEREWRLIHPIGTPFKYWWFHVEGEGAARRYFARLWTPEQSIEEKVRGGKAIRRVWLGCRADEMFKSTVMTAVREPHLRHVEVWEVSPCARDFKLIPKRVA